MSHTVIGRKRAEESQPTKGSSTTLTAHGDGTYHTSPNSWSDGPDRKEHDSIGAALMHMASLHAEGDHMHIQGHDDGYTTHHVMEGGKVEGPHEHKTLGALRKHLSCMEGEGAEGAD